MRALSIRQPWADWIICGRKTIETRIWRALPKIDFPERIYIHAGRSFDIEAYNLWRWHSDPAYKVSTRYSENDYPKGAILGTVEIAGIMHYIRPEQWERDFQKHLSPGLPVPAEDFYLRDVKILGLTLLDPVRFREPILYRGQLGFFEVNRIDTDK